MKKLIPHLKSIQDDLHEKLFQDALIQYANLGTTHTLEKFEKLGRLLDFIFWFFLLIHAIGMFFYDHQKILKDHKWLYFVIIIGYLLPFSLDRIYSHLKCRRLKVYQKEINAKEYLICYGKISKIITWHKEKQCLVLEVEFCDLKNQIQHKNINIPYPHSLVKNKEQNTVHLQPKNLVNAAVRLCLLPYSHFIFDLSIIDAQADKITIFEQRYKQNNYIWHQYIEGIKIHQQPIFLFDVSHIFFLHDVNSTEFQLKFQCVNQADTSISNQLKNFEQFENLILNYFKDISFDHYQQLKYSNTSQEEILWQSPKSKFTTHQKEILLQQLEMKIGLTFAGCFIIFIILLSHIHLYALMFLISSLIILIGTYLYYQHSQTYFILPRTLQL